MESPIFIVGIPRSGSTLWHNIISGSGKVLRVGEMHFLNPWRRDFRYFLQKNADDLSDIRSVEKMVDLMLSGQSVPGLTGSFWVNDITRVKDPEFKKSLCEQIYKSDKTVESFFRIITENMVKSTGYNRCCIKFPVYVNHVEKLIEWFPDCKVVHITRDPRAIAVSKTNDPHGTAIMTKKHPKLSFLIKKAMVLYTAIQYNWCSRLHLKYNKYDNYSLFKYEDLLVDEMNVVERLCKFIDIDFSPTMLAPKAGQSSSLTGEKNSGFDKKAGYRWKENISKADEFIVTTLTKGSMARFGFDPGCHPIYQNV